MIVAWVLPEVACHSPNFHFVPPPLCSSRGGLFAVHIARTLPSPAPLQMGGGIQCLQRALPARGKCILMHVQACNKFAPRPLCFGLHLPIPDVNFSGTQLNPTPMQCLVIKLRPTWRLGDLFPV